MEAGMRAVAQGLISNAALIGGVTLTGGAMSDAAGIIVLAGRLLFAFFFGFIAGYRGHVRSSQQLEGYARQINFPAAAIAGWPTGVWLILASLSIGLGVWPDVGSLMILAFLLTALSYFHRYWEIEDPMQKMTQQQLFWRNAFGIGACLIFFGMFVSFGPALRFAITGALFDF
jgi:putative oxidoreductase